MIATDNLLQFLPISGAILICQNHTGASLAGCDRVICRSDVSPEAERAVVLKGDKIRKPDDLYSLRGQGWEITWNCADYEEKFWELNGGQQVCPASFIRTPWGMEGEIE